MSSPIVNNSERYGTFYDSEDEPLRVMVEDGTWRVQKTHFYLSKIRAALGFSFALAVIFLFVAPRVPHLKFHERDGNFVAKQLEKSLGENEQPEVTSMRVYLQDDRRVSVEFGSKDLGPKAAVFARFNDSLHFTGWSQMWVETASIPSEKQSSSMAQRIKQTHDTMYASGFAEGALTHHRIDQHYQNVYLTFFPTQDEATQRTHTKVKLFLQQNLHWIRQQVAFYLTNPTLSEAKYWIAVGSILAQFDGLVQGYRTYSRKLVPISEIDLFLLNADGDMEDLVSVVTRGDELIQNKMDFATKSFYQFVKNLKCSALIRILPNLQDVTWGHATWDEYSGMNRIYKHYQVPLLKGDKIVKRKISMSSSPGYLSSVDDWYLTDQGLGIMETTNGVFDERLYDLVKPESILTWMRSKIANFLATDGPAGVSIFAEHNSGTYNNQWMVIDTKKFIKGQGFEPNGLTILEQMPGMVETADVSHIINKKGYWASYNVPYFDITYMRLGFQSAYIINNHSESWTHQNCSRARIFARDAPQIQDIEGLKKIMRYNNWKKDPLSKNHASHAIASRYDLETDPELFSLDGAIDAKVTSLERAKNMEADAISGPTHDNNPVFEWTLQLDKLSPNYGHPRVFNFDYVTMSHDHSPSNK
jgi:hypothetical protein